jgi:N-methylhydantoinase A
MITGMRIAIDTGGTFTDCVYTGASGLEILKVASTPSDPGDAVLRAVTQIAEGRPAEIRHGTTVGTNALLERKGARVAFVTTAGFEDTVAIGRQARPRIYDWNCEREPPLAPEELRFGIEERTGSDGEILRAPTRSALESLKEAVSRAKPDAIALSLLFSFANLSNEVAVSAALRELGLPVSASHEILPEFREYERASTVLINGCLLPIMQSYLGRLTSELGARGSRFDVMQSSGGIVSANIAAREPVRTILSGPAGGVVGALAVARDAGWSKCLAFDMGGTSTDVALIDSELGLQTTKESMITGLPVGVPTLNIHTVGAGGGSIAGFDRGGALKVGPQSAGADPGPICYGKGDQPTVSDANLLLGRLDPGGFLGGRLRLDLERVRGHFERAKGPISTIESFAEGIIRVADIEMERALRRISIEQGHDTRDFTLVSFGGAGPVHACALAKALRIPRVLVPNFPGALSAYGVLVSDTVRDYSRTVMLQPDSNLVVEDLDALEQRGTRELASEGLQGIASRSLDMRYAGQGYELQVPWSDSFLAEFHKLHRARYGYADQRRPVEIVNARVRMTALTEVLPLHSVQSRGGRASEAVVGSRRMYFEGAWHSGAIYERSQLSPGARFSGPALVLEYSATTCVPPEMSAQVDERGNLLIEVRP